ncbi:MAG: RNA-binding protein [Chloroflexi bacterium]|jgi:cold-inducible RNA-binding protein|nr:RNA-binding protein [Chloroflexota bacterium]HZW32897.1 RNA-binding protein [Isosphaeraceae bacterium]
MATRLYVGNLPYSVSEGELRRLFSQAGTVESVTMPLDHQTGRPRGFAFVQMPNDQEAETAIRMFNGYVLDGRPLRVNVAQEREARRGAGGRGW